MTIPTVGVVVFRGNQVLLVQKRNHPQQAFQLPGGQIEEGETVEDASIRELYENTELKADPLHLTVIPNEWHAIIEKDYGTKDFGFKCVLCHEYSGDIKDTKSATSSWVELSSLQDLNLVPNIQAAIEAALTL